MKPAAPEPAPEPTAAEEMDVLFPDLDVVVRDPDTGENVTLTVRELRFLEGLRLTAEGPSVHRGHHRLGRRERAFERFRRGRHR